MLVLLSMLLYIPSGYTQSAPAQPVYIAVTFYKVKPGKAEAYTSLVKTNAHKIVEGQFREKNILGWYFYEVIMPAGDQAPYDYVSVITSRNFGDLVDNPVTMKEMYAKTFAGSSPQQFQQYSNQLNDYRSVVKREIYLHRAGINEKTPVSRYVEIDYMKPFPGKAEEYVRMERDVYYPIHLERMKLGALTDWGLYQRLLPYSETAESDFVTANFFNNPRSIIDPKYEEAFNNMPNNVDFIRLSSQIDQTRKLVRSDVWKLVDFIDANNTK
ncbi:hypothetical protein FPE01S_02_00240 [Flavihumibacter petaseus NBRC 106054]|uniref:NIPSNAP domain-containing protein n=2 Tax=Flavihumibacter TaxID=1004301 RepID=A0A0E9MZ86_9BACT|nr:hypothetical protein FPE01S_02_00240 [Flavihumibacter petaseus NBRC 106054]